VDNNDLLTVTEAAMAARVHEETIRRWVRDGKLAAIRLPGGTYRIEPSVLTALLTSAVAS